MRHSIAIVQLCVACVAVWTLYIVTRPGTSLPNFTGSPVAGGDNDEDAMKKSLRESLTDWTMKPTTNSSNADQCHLHFGTTANDPMPIKEGQADGVAILINIVRNLDAPSIWNTWISSAFDYLRDMALEDTLVMKPSGLLRLYVHHSPLFAGESVREMLPPQLKDSLILKPAQCAPANPNPCHHRLLQFATADFANAGYFLLLDESSVPLKPFRHVYAQIQKDQRIRATLSDPCYTQSGLPRSFGAVGYPRQVADILLKNESWVDAPWRDGKDGPCSPNECSLWEWILEGSKGELTSLIVASERPKMDPNSASGAEVATLDVTCDTFRIRGNQECKLVEERWLQQQLENKDVWFGRGFSDHTQVKDANEAELSEYLTKTVWKLGQGSKGYREHPRQKEGIDYLKTWNNATIDVMNEAIKEERPWGLAL